MLKAMSLVAVLTLMAGAAHAEKPREQSKSKKVMVQELTLDQFQQKYREGARPGGGIRHPQHPVDSLHSDERQTADVAGRDAQGCVQKGDRGVSVEIVR